MQNYFVAGWLLYAEHLSGRRGNDRKDVIIVTAVYCNNAYENVWIGDPFTIMKKMRKAMPPNMILDE